MKYIFYTLLLTLNLFSNEVNTLSENSILEDNLLIKNTLTTEETSVFDDLNSEKVEELEPEIINYFEEVIKPEYLEEKNLYLSYTHFPEKIYKNQRFEVSVKALVTTSEYDRLETRFINSENMTVLNSESSWSEVDERTYENTFYFKAYEENFKMPTFQVILYRLDEIIDVIDLMPKDISFTQIGKNKKNFSLVIAENFNIAAYKTKQYNNSELIAILDIESNKSNLEDFYLEDVKEQGISNIEDKYPAQKILYYLVLPVHTKNIVFNYYNTQKDRFINIKLPVILENELVSTQTDLNPNKSNLLFYKKIALAIMVVIFLILFAWKRKYTYLFIMLSSLIVLLVYLMPNQTKILKAQSNVYILPTKNSTIFRKTDKDYLVETSVKKEGFIKVIFIDNKMIGWAKEKDLVKN